MKVTLTESGGFANIRRGCTVDTQDLPANLAVRLETMLCDGHLFVEHYDAPRARDARLVVIEVDCGGVHKRAAFTEAATPSDAEPVLRILRPYCRILPAHRD